MYKWNAVVIEMKGDIFPFHAFIQYNNQDLYSREGRYKLKSAAENQAQDYANVVNTNKASLHDVAPKPLTQWGNK